MNLRKRYQLYRPTSYDLSFENRVVKLKEFDRAITPEEIAHILDVSPGAVLKVLLRKGL